MDVWSAKVVQWGGKNSGEKDEDRREKHDRWLKKKIEQINYSSDTMQCIFS